MSPRSSDSERSRMPLSLPESAWQKALNVPHATSLKAARKLREQFPDLAPDELVQLATRSYLRRIGMESGAVGAAAAYPGAGTAVSAAASGAQLAAFVSESAHYAMTVAHLYGIDLRDPAKRTALVLAALTGREGAEMITAQVGIQTLAWFRNSFLSIRTGTAQQFNRLLSKWLRKKAVSKAATTTLGRLLPFGVGAVVGWQLGRSMAKSVVEGVQTALGPAPSENVEDVVIDVQPVEDPAADDELYEAIVLPDEE
ncbi:MAG: VPDSG-CTERM exosortase interaction domain protein [Actinomyces sp.]|nr:VPDSG-CTERM exosortase interaction domain protein [Actinomyces sp.]